MAKASQLQERYLEALRKAPPGSHPADVLRSCGIRPSELVSWRARPTFRKQEEPLLAEFRARQALPIAPQFIAFLDFFQESDDRLDSCKKAGVRWAAVEAELASNQVFRSEYDAIMSERNLALEDALYRKGKTGDTTSGKAYLAVNDPRYGKSEAPAPANEDAARAARTDALLQRLSKLAEKENQQRSAPSVVAQMLPVVPMGSADN